tara:strand:- start:3543 stop:4076 length:534 start_codon:yes stop_codon:yes gene_type:complete
MALYRQNGAFVALGTVGAVATLGLVFGRTRPGFYEEDVSIEQWGSPAREGRRRARWSPKVHHRYDLDSELRRGKTKKEPKVRIKITRPGKLGGSGYMSRPWEGVGGRKRILDHCVDEWGFRSCLGSITVFKTWWRNKPNMMRKYGDIIEHDANYLREAYGGRAQRRRSRRSARRKAG